MGPEDLPALLASIRLERGPVVLLVDDAERFDDSDQSLANLLASSAQVCVIAAGRSADLRGLYAHWTKTLRKSRCGVLLQPDVDYDGELLGVHPAAPRPGGGDPRPRLPLQRRNAGVHPVHGTGDGKRHLS